MSVLHGIEVVDWSPRWTEQYDEVADVLRRALAHVPSAVVEHVGSTSVPGLAARSAVLQQVLAASGEFTEAELRAIGLLNDPDA